MHWTKLLETGTPEDELTRLRGEGRTDREIMGYCDNGIHIYRQRLVMAMNRKVRGHNGQQQLAQRQLDFCERWIRFYKDVKELVNEQS